MLEQAKKRVEKRDVALGEKMTMSRKFVLPEGVKRVSMDIPSSRLIDVTGTADIKATCDGMADSELRGAFKDRYIANLRRCVRENPDDFGIN